MQRLRFEKLVRRALRSLPADLAAPLATVEIVVSDRATAEQLESVGLDAAADDLLGLYEGTALTDRSGSADGGLPVQDVIWVFQDALEDLSLDPLQLEQEVRRTVIHEIAHHFGLSEEDVDRLGYA